MIKVFIDTNVILDHALGRSFANEAEKKYFPCSLRIKLFVTFPLK